MSRCTCFGPNPNCTHCQGSGEIPENRAAALIGHACRPESEKIHPGVKPPKVEPDLGSDWTVCGRCGSNLKSKNLKSHQTKKCPRRASLVEYAPPARKRLRRTAQRHTMHSAGSVSRAPAAEGKSRSTNPGARLAAISAVRASIKSEISDAKVYSDQTVKNQDATHAYSTHYRENGRFGSHPSHDGFDDESGPD